MKVMFSIDNKVVNDFNKAHETANRIRDRYSKKITKSSIIEKAMISFIKKMRTSR